MTDQTDPQYKLRYSEELRDRLKEAAKMNNRSLNAEIVSRLQDSFVSEPIEDELVSAAKAKEIARIARSKMASIFKQRITEEVNQSVAKGHDYILVSFTDFDFDAMPEDEIDTLVIELSEWLENSGYIVEWDGNVCIITYNA